MSSTPVNVLIAGDCNGKLSALFKRVAAVNKSNGPFHVLFCVGGFFPTSDSSGDASDDTCELLEWISEGKQAPVSTYFIGAFGKGSAKAMAALQSSEANIHYLGRSGVTEVAGLSVAFLDGLYDSSEFSADVSDEGYCRHFRELDVAKLKLAVEDRGDVDLFLTCRWPGGILAAVPPSSLPKGMSPGARPPHGCAIIDELTDMIRPRYIVSGGEEIHYARPPYQNPDRGVGGHVTRFIAMAPFGNPAKEKSLHALKLVPMAGMELDVLMAKPADTTPYPFGATRAPQAPKRQAEVSCAHPWLTWFLSPSAARPPPSSLPLRDRGW